MQLFRKLLKHRQIAGLLLIGVFLRSLIAVGYMLDTEPTDGNLLSITICDGPAGINAISGLSKHKEHHEHHHGQIDEGHEHVVQDHSFSACSFWSSSNQTILAELLILDLSGSLLTDEVTIYQSNAVQQLTYHSRLSRAPPSLS